MTECPEHRVILDVGHLVFIVHLSKSHISIGFEMDPSLANDTPCTISSHLAFPLPPFAPLLVLLSASDYYQCHSTSTRTGSRTYLALLLVVLVLVETQRSAMPFVIGFASFSGKTLQTPKADSTH